MGATTSHHPSTGSRGSARDRTQQATVVSDTEIPSLETSDRMARALTARITHGILPHAFFSAWFDWLSHLLTALPRHAQVRAVHLSLEPWTFDAGILTPTLKVKREVLQRQFATVGVGTSCQQSRPREAQMNLKSLIPVRCERYLVADTGPFTALQREIDRLFEDFSHNLPSLGKFDLHSEHGRRIRQGDRGHGRTAGSRREGFAYEDALSSVRGRQRPLSQTILFLRHIGLAESSPRNCDTHRDGLRSGPRADNRRG
jgi:hypothetical protein